MAERKRKGPVRESFDPGPAGQIGFHKARVLYDVGEILKMMAMFDSDPNAITKRAEELVSGITRNVVMEMTNTISATSETPAASTPPPRSLHGMIERPSSRLTAQSDGSVEV